MGGPVGDLDGNCRVGFGDLRVLAQQWLEDVACSQPNCANLDGIGPVSMPDFALLADKWLDNQSGLIITEFMANNDDAFPDEEGKYPDWIEIYNPMDTAVDLGGWYLTDNDSNLTKWEFPAGAELDSGHFIVVFASGNDRRDPNKPLHTNFQLDDGGDNDDVALVTPDGTTIVHEYARYPRQLSNVSYGLMQYAKTLVAPGDDVLYHVPTGDDTDANWTGVAFDDSSWQTGPTGLSFGFGGAKRASYNDCVFEGGQYKGENVTEYGIGGGFGGDTSGPLLDQLTGEPTGVTVTFEQSGGVNWQPDPGNGGSDCAEGTDAFKTFAGLADMTGVIYYGSVGWWIDMTFSGLDPGTEYTFATSAARDRYDGRLAIYTISGADAYTNASTPGVDILAQDKARFNTGDNHSEGYVARWTGIRASDGTFKVRAEPDPSSPESRKAYSFDVFMLEGGFGGTNVRDQMLGVNSSLWTRAEFHLEQGERDIFEKLTLRIKYEDGFVAYLNGQKVAARNAPDSPEWNSRSLSDRPIEGATVFESINLTAHIDALRDGTNILAVHALNDSTGDDEFLVLPELVAASGTGVPQYFTEATFSGFNVAGAAGLVSDVWFSHERGFYEDPFDLTLSTEMSDAEIRYTVDGSRPSATNGSVYTPGSPIRIAGTTPLRAVAVKPGYLDSEVETHTYIFLGDVVTQSPAGQAPGSGWPSGSVNGQMINYGMDPDVVNSSAYADLMDDALAAIPTFSIVTHLDNLFHSSSGIYVNARGLGRAWERPTSLELIYPSGFDGFQINAGLRIRGGYSRSGSNPKHAFRLFFRSEYGDGKLEYPLFGDEGVDEFDHMDLRTAQNYSWSYHGDNSNTMAREIFSRDTQRDMNRPYTRSRYYHLYINGQYWGIFQTQERSEASYCESYFGGDSDDYDVVKSRGGNPDYQIEATDGNLDAWRRIWDVCNEGFSDENYYRIQGLNTDGTPNPAYEKLLDIDNLIDYMICTYYVGDPDGPVSAWARVPNNFYGLYNRNEPDGFKFFRHDGEHSLHSLNENRLFAGTTIAVGAQFSQSNPLWFHTHLIEHPEYRMRFADRVQKHFFNDGALVPEACIARFKARTDVIDLAIIAESARWGDAKVSYPRTRNEHWLPQIEHIINDYLPYRTNVVLNQFKSQGWYPNLQPPVFSHSGGAVSKDYPLAISAGGTVYYTLDGSDPRLPGGAVNTSHANAYSGPVSLSTSTHIKARTRSGSTWSALREAVWAVGPVAESLRITEIMYHPRNTGDPDDPNEEYIELQNIGPERINVNLVRFTDGIDFTFGDIDLDPAEFIIVVAKESAFRAAHPGFAGKIAGEYTGRLDNAGEEIKLEDAIGRAIHDFEYKDGWRSITDGGGYSLTIIETVETTSSMPADGLVAHWRFDDGSGGTALDSIGTNDGTLHGDASWMVGRIGGALSLDGSGDYVSAASVETLEGDTVTVAAWVRVTGLTGTWNPVLIQHDLTSDGYYFYVYGDRPTFSVRTLGTNAAATGSETVAWDEWHHLTGTNDGSTVRLYVNGRIKGSAPSTGMYGADYDLYVGYDYSSEAYFSGLVDDVRIYERALAEYEIGTADPTSDRWGKKDSWRASVEEGGSPGSDDSGILPNPGSIVINEVLAHSHGEAADWIELYNTTAGEIDIGGWYLSDSSSNLKMYKIEDGTKIDSGEYMVFYEDANFGEFSTDPGKIVGFALSENGDAVYLSSADGETLLGYRETEDFGASTTGVSFGRYYKKSTGNYNFVAMDHITPRDKNSYPKVGPVVINEIMYNPTSGDQRLEYVELHNTGTTGVTLYDYNEGKPWKFTDGINYTFPDYPGYTIPPGGFVIIAKDITAYLDAYGFPPAEVVVLGPYSGKLSNSGEKLELSIPGDVDIYGTRYYIRVDRVNYSDGSHPGDAPGDIDLWPTEPDGGGMSLTRDVPGNYGNDPNNWVPAVPSPGL